MNLIDETPKWKQFENLVTEIQRELTPDAKFQINIKKLGRPHYTLRPLLAQFQVLKEDRRVAKGVDWVRSMRATTAGLEFKAASWLDAIEEKPGAAGRESLGREGLALGAHRSLLYGAAEGPAGPFRAEAADRPRSIPAVRQLSQGGLQESGNDLPVRFARAGKDRLE